MRSAAASDDDRLRPRRRRRRLFNDQLTVYRRSSPLPLLSSSLQNSALPTPHRFPLHRRRLPRFDSIADALALFTLALMAATSVRIAPYSADNYVTVRTSFRSLPFSLPTVGSPSTSFSRSPTAASSIRTTLSWTSSTTKTRLINQSTVPVLSSTFLRRPLAPHRLPHSQNSILLFLDSRHIRRAGPGASHR